MRARRRDDILLGAIGALIKQTASLETELASMRDSYAQLAVLAFELGSYARALAGAAEQMKSLNAAVAAARDRDAEFQRLLDVFVDQMIGVQDES